MNQNMVNIFNLIFKPEAIKALVKGYIRLHRNKFKVEDMSPNLLEALYTSSTKRDGICCPCWSRFTSPFPTPSYIRHRANTHHFKHQLANYTHIMAHRPSFTIIIEPAPIDFTMKSFTSANTARSSRLKSSSIKDHTTSQSRAER